MRDCKHKLCCCAVEAQLGLCNAGWGVRQQRLPAVPCLPRHDQGGGSEEGEAGQGLAAGLAPGQTAPGQGQASTVCKCQVSEAVLGADLFA